MAKTAGQWVAHCHWLLRAATADQVARHNCLLWSKPQACILSGCHYVDVTGEIDWVNAMRKRYNTAAQASDSDTL